MMLTLTLTYRQGLYYKHWLIGYWCEVIILGQILLLPEAPEMGEPG